MDCEVPFVLNDNSIETVAYSICKFIKSIDEIRLGSKKKNSLFFNVCKDIKGLKCTDGNRLALLRLFEKKSLRKRIKELLAGKTILDNSKVCSNGVIVAQDDFNIMNTQTISENSVNCINTAYENSDLCTTPLNEIVSDVQPNQIMTNILPSAVFIANNENIDNVNCVVNDNSTAENVPSNNLTSEIEIVFDVGEHENENILNEAVTIADGKKIQILHVEVLKSPDLHANLQTEEADVQSQSSFTNFEPPRKTAMKIKHSPNKEIITFSKSEWDDFIFDDSLKTLKTKSYMNFIRVKFCQKFSCIINCRNSKITKKTITIYTYK